MYDHRKLRSQVYPAQGYQIPDALKMLMIVWLATSSRTWAIDVFVLRGGDDASDAQVVQALQERGHNVTADYDAPDWPGTEPDLSDFDAVVLLYNARWPSQMQPAAEVALRAFVEAGGGLVTGEWFVWGYINAELLGPLLPVQSYCGWNSAPTTTYTEVTFERTIANGLPPSFSFDLSNFSGSESCFQADPAATVFYSSSNGGGQAGAAGLLGWKLAGGGRIASFSTLIGATELANSSYRRLFANAVEWTATTPSLYIASHSPVGVVLSPVAHVQVTFSAEINEDTLTIDDLVAAGPAGSISVDRLPEDQGGNVWRISFSPQSAEGEYCLSIGPHIEDVDGNEMDQDSDGTPGEGSDDVYDAMFYIGEPALQFDGVDDSVEILDDDTQQITTDHITISAWMHLSEDVGDTQRRIVEKQEDYGIAWGLEVFGAGYDGATGNQVVFHDSDGQLLWYNCISPTHLNPNQWYHIAATDDAGTIRIYVDGQLDWSCEGGYGIPSPIDAPVIIGAAAAPSQFFFDGTIDEVSLWSIARTRDEILASMCAAPTGAEPGLVGYWNFNEPEDSQTVMDLSPNGNDGQRGSTPGVDENDPLRVASGRPRPGFVEIALENNWVFGREPGTTQSPSNGLIIKSEGGLYWYRKAYLKFDLSDPLYSEENLSGELTVALRDFGGSGSVQVNLYGIIDNDDEWSQDFVTWNNAPHNNVNSYTFVGEGTTSDAPARLLAQFNVAASDPEDTTYGPFDLGSFLRWAVGQNPNYSALASDDNDRVVTIALRSNTTNEMQPVTFHSDESASSENTKPHLALSFGAAEHSVLCVNVHGSSYDGDGANVYETLLRAGADATFVNLDYDGEAAALIDANVYDQIWVFDLSSWTDDYPADWQAISDWFNADPSRVIICDARMISSYWHGRWTDEGLRVTENYYENMRSRGGGLLLGTDHAAFHSGINSINAQVGIDPFHGMFYLNSIPVDTANPLMTVPNDMGLELWDDSTPGQTPYGLQPNGRILYTVAWHSGNPDTPGISATIEGIVGFHIDITSPADGATFGSGETISFSAAPTGGDPPFSYEWFSDIDGSLGLGQNLEVSTLSINDHTITVLAEDNSGRDDDDSITVSVIATPDLQVTDIDTPCAGAQGQAFEVMWTVTNDGTDVASGTWTGQILLSDDAVIGDDTPLATFSYTGDLAIGESYTRTEMVTLPGDALGEHWIVVITDVNDDVDEGVYEENNSAVDDESFYIHTPDVVSFCAWYDVDYQGGGAGVWVVAADGLSVHQEINGEPTYFVSDFDLAASQFLQGSFRVQSGEWDDDYIGFVFGFKGLGGVGVDEGYYLFSWKRGNQDAGEAGFKLLKIIGPSPNLWDGEPTSGQIVQLARDTGSSLGWEYGVEYNFFLTYQVNGNIRVIIRRESDEQEMWNTGLLTDPDPLGAGKVGFYNYSQENVFYAGFTQGLLEWPVAVAGGPYAVAASMADVTLDATDSWDPDGELGGFDDIVSLQWDLGNDGIEDDEGRTDPHEIISLEDLLAKGLALGVDVPIGLTVVDADGLEDSDVGVIQYSNSPPTADAGGPYGPVYPGTSVQLQGVVDDPDLAHGVGESLVVEWDVTPATQSGEIGDGFADQAVVAVSYETLLPLHRDYGETFYLNVADASGSVLSSETTIELALPDLEATDVTAPTEGMTGESFELTWRVTNTGEAMTIDSWVDRIYLSEDDQPGGDQLVEEVSFLGQLASGAHLDRDVSLVFPMAPGVYWIVVIVDAADAVYETDGDNNIIVSDPLIVRGPNLIISNVDIPLEGLTGQPIDVSWTVANEGPAPATGSWEDCIYLSDDDQIGGDTPLGCLDRPVALDPGELYDRVATAIIPAIPEGWYWIIVCADDGDVLPEDDETDNCMIDPAPIHIYETPCADLEPSGLVIPSEPVAAGKEAYVDWVVTNIGNGATNAPFWYDRVHLSVDQTVGGSVWTTDFRNPMALNPGEAYPQNVQFTVPGDFPPGSYYVCVEADARNDLAECLEDNNIVVSASMLQIEQRIPPILAMTNCEVDPPEPWPGDPITVTWTITNTGQMPTGPFTIDHAIVFSENEILDPPPGDQVLAWHVGDLSTSLEPGETSEPLSAAVNIPLELWGSYYIIVWPDPPLWVDLDRSPCAVPITVQTGLPADLEVDEVVAPASGSSGQPVAITWTVRNAAVEPTHVSWWDDRIYLSEDDDFGTTEDNILIGTFRHNGILNFDESYTAPEEREVILPDDAEGLYYVFVHADANDRVYEGDWEENNVGMAGPIDIIYEPPDLQVQEVAVLADGLPAESVLSGTTVTVEWTVVNTGSSETTASWSDRVYISEDDVLDGSDPVLATVAHSGSLGSSENYTAAQDVTIPIGLSSDAVYIFVCADYADEVYESDDGNNCDAGDPFEVIWAPPDLQVESVDVDTGGVPVESGSAVAVEWTVINTYIGATPSGFWSDCVYISADDVLDGDDPLLATVSHSGALDPDESYPASTSVQIPIHVVGPEIYVFVDADCDDASLRIRR